MSNTLLIMLLAWLAGIITARGTLSAFFAVLIPVYAWYIALYEFIIYFNLQKEIT